jgi:hypothetical protein
MKTFILIAMIALAGLLVAAQDEGRGKDGKYHDPETGEVQPDHCDNSFKNEHPCDCSRAKSCDPDAMSHHPTRVCKTWCRTNACGCVNECTS